MKFAKSVLHFILLELKLEFRLKYAFAALLMYVLSTVYLVYFSLEYQGVKESLMPVIWSIFFWLIILFTTVNTTFGSFSKDSDSKMLFYYNLLNPRVFIVAKIIYNALLSLVLSILTGIIFTIILGNPTQSFWIYLLTLSVGTVAYSTLFSYISSTAAKAGGNAVLAVVLGFPLSIPLLTIIVKLFSEALKPEVSSNFNNNLIIVLGFNFVLLLLSVILFPYIWRD